MSLDRLQELLRVYDQLSIVDFPDAHHDYADSIKVNGTYHLVQGELQWRYPVKHPDVSPNDPPPKYTLKPASWTSPPVKGNFIETTTLSRPSKIATPTILGSPTAKPIAKGHLYTTINRTSLHIPDKTVSFPIILKVGRPSEEDLEQGALSQQLALKRIANEHQAYTTYLRDLQGYIVPRHHGTFILPYEDDRPPFMRNGNMYPQWKAVAMLLEDVGRGFGTKTKGDDEKDVAFFEHPLKERINVFKLCRELGTYGIVHNRTHPHHIRITPQTTRPRLLPCLWNATKTKTDTHPYRIIDFSESRYYAEDDEMRDRAVMSQKAWVGMRTHVHEDENGVPIHCKNLRNLRR